MSGKLFTPEERAICEKFADFSGQLINKRAAILLLLDDGKTQSQACTESGMTLGQLRYALALFRKEGIAMFPQEQTAEASTPSPAPAPEKKEKKEEVKEKKVKAEKKAAPKKKKPSEKDKKKAKKKLQKASKPKKKKKKKKK